MYVVRQYEINYSIFFWMSKVTPVSKVTQVYGTEREPKLGRNQNSAPQSITEKPMEVY